MEERNIDEVWIQQANIEKPLQEDRREQQSKESIDVFVKKLNAQRKKKKIMKQNLKKKEASIAEIGRQNEMLRNQNENMALSIEKLVNTDFDELLRGKKLRSSGLTGHVQSKMRDVLQYALNKASDSERLELSLNEVQEAYELIKQELDFQESETGALIEEINILEEKNIEVAKQRDDAKRLQVEVIKKLRNANKVIDRLSADNSKLIEGSIEGDEDDGDFVQGEDRRYSARYKEHILRMFRIGLSVGQVSQVLEETLSEIYGGKHSIPGSTFLNDLRQDLGPLCDVFTGLKLALAVSVTQAGHDGSSIFENDTLTVNLILKFADGSYGEACLSSSFLTEAKDAECTHLAILELVKRIKTKYQMFLDQGEAQGLDIRKYPPSSAINIEKFSKASIMSDNNTTAVKVSNLLIASVLEAVARVHGGWGELSIEAKDELFHMIQTRCFGHIRCLCANDGVLMETEWLKENYTIPEEWKAVPILGSTLKAELDCLILSCQKYFCDDEYVLFAGVKTQFDSWMQAMHNDIHVLSLGRKGTGNRMDMSMALAYNLSIMYPYYVEYSMVKKDSGGETIINKSIRLRLASKYFQATIVARARLWCKLYYPFRNLCQAKLENFYIYDMGLVADALYECAHSVLANPREASRDGFNPFPYSKFPALRAFDMKNQRPMYKIEREAASVYNVEVDQELVDEVMVLHFKGVLKALEHNARDYMTVFDGKLCYHKWTTQMKSDAESMSRDNIVCESVFAMVDHVYRAGGRGFKIGTVDGIVRSMMCKLFDEDVFKDLFTPRDKECLLSMLSRNRKAFKAERDEDMRQQRQHKIQVQEQKEEAARVKMGQVVVEMVSVFYLQRIETKRDLGHVLSGFKSDAAKIRVLKKQLLIYINGYGWQQYKQSMSKKGDPTVGGVADLTSRLETILQDIRERKVSIPSEPAYASTETIMSKFQELRYDTCQVYSDIVSKRVGEVLPSLLQRLVEYTEVFSPRLSRPLDDLKEIIWPQELSEFQLKFKPKTRFRYRDSKGRGTAMFEFEVLGIVWDDDESEYSLYYYDISKERPTTHKEVKLFAFFEDSIDEDGTILRFGLCSFDRFAFVE